MITDMSQGRPAAILWRFTIPMLLSAVFQQLYNVADSVWRAGLWAKMRWLPWARRFPSQ